MGIVCVVRHLFRRTVPIWRQRHSVCSFVQEFSICNERRSHDKIDGGPRVFTHDYTTTSGYLTKLPSNSNVNENALKQISSNFISWHFSPSWWRHQMEAFSALLAICAGNSPVTGEYLRSSRAAFDKLVILCMLKDAKSKWTSQGFINKNMWHVLIFTYGIQHYSVESVQNLDFNPCIMWRVGILIFNQTCRRPHS